jgi:hypothetical protein
MNRTQSWSVILGLLLTTLACHQFAPNERPALIQPTSAQPTPTSAPPALSPPAPTPIPTNLPLPTPVPDSKPVVGDALIEPDDLSPYRQAMRPQFAADVETVAAAGASRYDLEVNLAVGNDDAQPVTLAEIYFRLYPNLPGYGAQMTVEQVSVDDQPVEPELTAANSALRVPLPRPLAPAESIKLNLSFRAAVPANGAGYNIFSVTDQTIALAGFYPAIAVYDDEGWNVEVPPPYGDATYLDVSLYQVQLTVPAAMVVTASGSQIDRTMNGDGTKTLRLASGPMRDFYVAMRAEFQSASEVVDGITVTSYYPPELQAGGTLALRYAADSLRLFNEEFGPYPYAEFDIIATPTLAGGVEYPGIVVISQRLYDQEGGFFEHATVHEVAHQWWYGLVGNDQVDEPWLDESLTNYSTVFYWEKIEGREIADQVVQNFFWGPYERAKSQGQDRPVAGAVEDFTESDYSTFVYGKGPLFFDALRREVGDDTFLAILQTYFAAYKYRIAHPDDLLAIIEQVSGQEVDPLFEKWIEQ